MRARRCSVQQPCSPSIDQGRRSSCYAIGSPRAGADARAAGRGARPEVRRRRTLAPAERRVARVMVVLEGPCADNSGIDWRLRRELCRRHRGYLATFYRSVRLVVRTARARARSPAVLAISIRTLAPRAFWPSASGCRGSRKTTRGRGGFLQREWSSRRGEGESAEPRAGGGARGATTRRRRGASLMAPRCPSLGRSRSESCRRNAFERSRCPP
jgi:hypothetical protein